VENTSNYLDKIEIFPLRFKFLLHVFKSRKILLKDSLVVDRKNECYFYFSVLSFNFRISLDMNFS
jgi:hypothetical protein